MVTRISLVLTLILPSISAAVASAHATEEPSDIRLLQCWKTNLEITQQDQLNAAKRWDRRAFLIGMGLVVFTAVTGASFFTEVSQKRRGKSIVAAISLSAAVLAGLQTFLKPAERAAQYKHSSDEAEDLQLQISETLLLSAEKRDAARTEIRKRIADLRKASPITVYWPEETTMANRGDI